MEEDHDDSSDKGVEVMENAIDCPQCGDVTGHEILRKKEIGTGADFLIKCDECHSVHTVQFRPKPVRKISFRLTEGPTSDTVNIDIGGDEWIAVHDIFEHEDKHWRISRIELADDSLSDGIYAHKVARVTAIRADIVRVKITMTLGEDSFPDIIEVEPDKMFSCGGIYVHNNRRWRIRAIHTGEGRILNGKKMAVDIKRIYMHEPPQEEIEYQPKGERERRQAWKEGRLGYNPNPERSVRDKFKRKKPDEDHSEPSNPPNSPPN